VVSVTENSNKFQKTRFFWKEKSVEDVVTLEPRAHRSHQFTLKSILRQKKNYEIQIFHYTKI
jgi:hypothetical protein